MGELALITVMDGLFRPSPRPRPRTAGDFFCYTCSIGPDSNVFRTINGVLGRELWVQLSMMPLLKKPSAWIPIAIPLLFIAYIVSIISFFGVVREKDEGVGAPLFQLWLILEPFMLGYFALTYAPREPKNALIILALQAVAALLPISAVFSLGL